MKKTTFKKLLESEDKLNKILIELDISIKNHDRIHKAFSILRELEHTYTEKEALDKMLLKHGQLVVSSSLHDISMIDKILKNCHNIPPKILKNKLKLILKGSLFHEESIKTTESRNTLFELILYSSFIEAGYEVKICDPNPDILLNINSRKYNIQCKRVFTDTYGAIYENIKNAVSQLKKDIDRCQGSYGIVAISVEEILAKKRILDSYNPQEGLDFVSKQIEMFINKYSSKIWLSKYFNTNKKILAIIVYMNTIAIMKDEGMQSNVAQFTITNIVDKDDLSFKILRTDLKQLLDNEHNMYNKYE